MASYFAGYQELEWFDEKRQRNLLAVIWYPTQQAEQPITYLAHFHTQASLNAPFVEGKFPLVILSHGSRGHRYNQYYLAEFLARAGYLVIAIEHTGDTAFDDMFSNSQENHIHRINDLLFVYQEITNHPTIGKYIHSQTIAHIGHSFGGLSGYILSGGLSNLIPSNLNKIVQSTFQKVLKCIVLLAPALSETVVIQQSKLSTPTLLVTAEQDELLGQSPNRYLNYYKFVDSICYPNTGHFVFLMPCPEQVAIQYPELAYDRGTPRILIHPKLNESIKVFLNNYLR
jgi:dienelactone hydrolase